MDPSEPYWRTNSSFSPPLSGRGDYRLQSEGLPYARHNAVQLYGSSLSSNSKESRGQWRDDNLPHHQYSASDRFGSYFSSPSDSFQTPQWTPPPRQGVNIDDYVSAVMREPVSEPLSSTPSMERTSAVDYSAGSSSSGSDGSEYGPIAKMHTSSNRNSSSRRLFMSKPIHPVAFPNQTERETHGNISTGNTVDLSNHSENRTTRHLDPKSIQIFAELQSISGVSEFDATTPHRETLRWSSASSSVDFNDVSEQLDSENISPCNLTESFRCGLCDKFLSQKSPWSARRIVRSGDMPVTGVLSCCHVFHADCLEQTTPKTHKLDPPCPLCVRSEEIVAEHGAFSRLRNGFSRLKSFREEGPSRPWGCGQVGDCVEGALHAPPRNTLVLLNQSRLKKHHSLNSNSSKGVPDKLKKNMSHSSHILNRISVDHGAGGCSKIVAEPALKRC
ncbi:uncharacterized protein LOC122670920 isoform X1 [Telopea speciosissima]|uniref:uncharacterized protein LOC122670920 isoform X1 n=1 Tax=Telopea speciosissima TaxID=54955 RepID=UPI001CC82B4C|nr:uncharacterized protein LOC122670920 isoform X1 [Telopea speciosissima]